ncbi:hypothetical protein GW17_00042089 [Ensete ventricosum]|nr:hypothetical protein GW17_00042089 [Ensete ventricosum]
MSNRSPGIASSRQPVVGRRKPNEERTDLAFRFVRKQQIPRSDRLVNRKLDRPWQAIEHVVSGRACTLPGRHVSGIHRPRTLYGESDGRFVMAYLLPLGHRKPRNYWTAGRGRRESFWSGFPHKP